MATDERLYELFSELERPVAPDPAFAGRLYERLRLEAGFAPSVQPTWRRWLPDLSPDLLARRLVLTPRLVILALLALLLAASVGAAAYIAIQGWLSTGPRGIQFSDDFTFAEVYREGGEPIEAGPMPTSLFYPEFAMTRDGAAMYAIRIPAHLEQRASIVRFTGLAGDRLAREEVLGLATLSDPALWDADLELSSVDIGLGMSNDDRLSIGPGGELFLALGAYGRERQRLPHADELEEELRSNWPDITDDEIERATTRQPLLASSLVVLRPDGSRQRVVTIAELQAAGLMPDSEGDVLISAVASSVDRLWLKSEVLGPETNSAFLFEVLDPNRDGDWTDRIVLPLVLPEAVSQPGGVPQAGDEGGAPWLDQGLVAEASSEQVDRTRSVLLPVLSTDGEYRVYRLTDRDDDGELRGEGEVELVFSGQPAFGDMPGPSLASRVIMEGGQEVLRELLVSGISGPSRIARVSPDGSIKDIARALPHGPQDIEAAPNGDIFVVVQESGTGDTGPSFVVYRLAPVPVGEGPTASASPAEQSPSPAASASPSPSPAASETITAGVPRIAYTLDTLSAEETSRIMVVGADTSGPVELIPGEHNSAFCQSADGSLIAFWSDEEVPHEPFLYVANADGTDRRKISEDVGSFWCGFSSRYLLTRGRGGTSPIVRRDLETGEEAELLTDADATRIQADPFGLRYLVVSDAETLEVIDIETRERRTLQGPLPEDRAFEALTWSADGELVTYAVGPRPSTTGSDPVGPVEVYVQEVAEGAAARLVHSFQGRAPRLGISSDARHLLVSPPSAEVPGPITLVDLASGEVRVTAQEATWGGWHPDDPARFAYATKTTLFLASLDGTAQELAQAPTQEWCCGNWIGWSPDGRYIGLPDFASAISIIDVTTGELRILARDVGESFAMAARWLR